MAAPSKIEVILSLSVKQFKTAVKKVDREFMTVIRSGQAFRKTLDDLNGHANILRSTLIRFGAVIGGGALFGAAARSAFDFNQTMEQSRIGIAALIRTFQDVDIATSFRKAADIQKRLQIAGLKTTATYKELLVALQEGIGPALRENFDPSQIVSFTSSMTQAAAALSLPMNQLGQELRAILDGTIDRNARIARALQISNTDIKKWKAAGTLFKNLQDRLKEFAAAGDQAANTFGGALSNMYDAIQMALGHGAQKTFSATTEAIRKVRDAIVTIDDEAGTFTFNRKIVIALDEVDKKISGFIKSITAEDIAAAIEEIVKTSGAAFTVILNFSRAIAQVVKTIGQLAPGIATIAGNFLLMSAAVKAVGFVVLEPYRLVKGMISSILVMKRSQVVAWLGGLRTATIEVAGGVSALSVAFKGFLALAAADAVIRIGRLIAILWDWKKATDELKQAQADLAAQKSFVDAAAAPRLREINDRLGTTFRTMDELFAAEKAGKVAYDDLTGTWVRGAGEMTAATERQATAVKQVTGKALEEMKKKYRQYADEVIRLQEQIAGRSRSLAEQLRAMARTGMSDINAWRDRKREAEEYEQAAKKAAEAGDFKDAVKLADKARAAYADLNREVKDGDRVLVSQQYALRTSMDGVKRAGELAIDALKKQQAAAKDAMDELTAKSGFQDLEKGMDESKKKWLDNWRAMQAAAMDELDKVERRIRKIVTDQHMTIYVDEVVRRAAGGLIRRFATGGRLPGYGGGDRIPALLEAGEYIIRKEAVSRFGAGIFHALNNLRLPELPKFATGGPVAAGSGASGETININLTMPTGTYPVRTDRMTADRMLRDLARMQRLRSA